MAAGLVYLHVEFLFIGIGPCIYSVHGMQFALIKTHGPLHLSIVKANIRKLQKWQDALKLMVFGCLSFGKLNQAWTASSII